MPRDLTMPPGPDWPDPPGGTPRAERKIFEDPTGRRRLRVLAVVALLLVVLGAWLGEFGWRVWRLEPALPAPVLAGIAATATAPPRTASLPLADGGCASVARAAGAPDVFAYLPAGDARARAGFRAACGAIDALLHDALTLRPDGQVAPQAVTPGAGTLAAWLGTGDLPPAYPIVRPAPGLGSDQIGALLLGQPGAARIAEQMVAAGAADAAAGVCLSLADQPAVFAGALRRLLAEWTPRARAAGQEVCLIARAGAALWRDALVVAAVDRAVVLGFEASGRPDAAATRAQVDQVLAPLARAVPQDKLVLVPGSFGLLWQSGAREPDMVSFADAMVLADHYRAGVAFSDETGISRVGFLDDRRQRNEIWLMDAVSFRDQLAAVPEAGAVGVWPLGYEDPAVWSLIGAPADPAALAAPVVLDGQLSTRGEGPFVVAAHPARPGAREIAAADGRVQAVAWTGLPLPARIDRAGAGRVGELAVTFDGLPEPEALPALLETLKRAGVRATFFASARQLLDHPDAAAAILGGGHGFGTTLLSLDQGWPTAEAVRRLTLNRMQLQLSGETGHRTAFVREASGRLVRPETRQDFAHLLALVEQGYVPVTAGFAVPVADMAATDRIDLVRRGVIARGTNVLSVDLTAGAADVTGWLPGFLDVLARDGFSFVALDALATGPAPLGALDSGMAAPVRDAVTFAVLGSLQGKLAVIFMAMLALDATRALVYLSLALQRRRRAVRDPAFLPGVTVLVPAYNEEDVIERCLTSLVRSDYPNMRIIVIDDGSTDRTARIVRENWLHDPRISLISQQNAGKCHAANHALEHVRTPIFVGIDADTIVQPDAITWLVQQFKDPRVGAVSGFVEVGNRRNYLTRAQALEYIVSQAVGRRAFDMFDGILVVPGAIGAWRMAAVAAAGQYSGETITEDADLTVAIHRAGYRVRFEEHARAFTEAPETVRPLIKQRIRWSLGMLQTAWKHRGAIREGRPVGVISLVDAVWISFLNCVFAPLVDLILVAMMVKAVYALATVGAAAITPAALVGMLAFFGLVIVDTATASAAFALERRRDWGLVALVPLLRFGYRQIMVFATLSALARAVTGRLYGWNKLSRTGTVLLPGATFVPGE